MILLLTKGIIRDSRLRRMMMFWLTLVVIVMFAAGTAFLTTQWARQHPWLYLGYWFLCAWLVVLDMLLALMDILVLRAAQRAARRVLEAQILQRDTKTQTPSAPPKDDGGKA